MDVLKDVSHTYIHIPFCKKICSYCDFCKVFYNKEISKKYLKSLEKEIKEIYKGEYQKTIYIGGGTPSVLDIEELKDLLEIVEKLNHDKQTEITFECNFDSVTKEKIDLLAQYGINRLSFGLETTKKNVLNQINRDLDKEEVKKIIEYSRKKGISNINIDLMYGFENTNLEDLKKDIDFILELNPTHISTYSLEIHDNTKFAIDKVLSMNEELDRMMYDYIHKQLTENNYIHYEISNYSKKGFESKHNLCYWNNKCYYGFGVGASSYINNERITNSRSITSYINNNIKREIETLNTKDKIVYELILGLRLKDGINLRKFKQKYNKEINEIYNLNNLIKENKIIINNDFIKVPFDKWYTINSILIDFLEVNYE